MFRTRHISQDGSRPNEGATDAINKLEPSIKTKPLKRFLCTIQYFANINPNLSEKTDNMRRLLVKKAEWFCIEDWKSDFGKIKEELATLPWLAHYNCNKKNFVNTDACKTCIRY